MREAGIKRRHQDLYTPGGDASRLLGACELQHGLVIGKHWRAKGFDLSISRPQVLFVKSDGVAFTRAHLEEVTLDVDDDTPCR